MKKIFLLVMFCLLLMVSHAIGADLTGYWRGSMICSPDGEGDGDQIILIQQNTDNDTFVVVETYTYNENDDAWYPGSELCSGVVDGNKFYMSCNGFPDSKPSFAHGETKGKVLYGISYVPDDGKACKGVYNKISEEDLPEPLPLP